MKRIIVLLIVLLSFFTINTVYADMSAPEMRAYEVVVTNPNGVDYYKWDGTVAGHLNKGDKVYVMYEYNGEYTLGVNTNKYGFETKESLGEVKSLDGFELVESEVDPSILSDDKTITTLDGERFAKVLAEDGVDILKGPSNAYEKVGHIKKDTILKYKYVINSFDSTTHIYVDYDGVKGWVEILHGTVLIQNFTQYVFKTDVVTDCGTIPKNTIMTPNYKTDNWTKSTQFEYNGCKFMYNTFRDDRVLDVFESHQKTLSDMNIYKYADESSEVLGSIPANSIITVFAGGDFMAETENVRYIKYNDITGWVLASEDNFEYISEPDTIEPETLEDTIVTTPEKEPEGENDIGHISNKIGVNTLILLCGFGVGLLVITALVIIILVNRSKKTEKTKEEK